MVCQSRESHFRSCIFAAYAGNDGVAIAVGDKVLNGPWCSCSQMVTTDEVGSDIEFGCIRACVPRTLLIFGGVCMAICQCAIGLWRPVNGQRGHFVSVAKVAESVDSRSVENGVGGAVRRIQNFMATVCPARLSLRLLLRGTDTVGNKASKELIERLLPIRC